ncbi:hypothetical protein IFM89_038714 [Coptis chinensis]|uniref:RRM domain-containing protein n=1 Tax=Coptis chinensis TaxID=261450 RepID=A0A835LFS0_9MAGN|nr:hypothetical protein IFM89_038714 [Coptis chinensis]
MARQNIHKWFSPKLRSWKYGLQHKILKNCESEQDAILSCPTGFDPSHWEAFAIHESRQEVKDLCAKNAQNRSMNFVIHTCGRKPYSRILEELDEENPGKKHRHTDGWKYGHEHRDGTVLNNARELYGILENMRHNGSTNGQPCMHTTEVDSTFVRRTQQVPNLNPHSRLSSNPNVKILGRKGEHVANGYVKIDSKKCHFRDIVGDEKVVYVTNVLVGDAPVYDGPQDDIAYLRDIATGGFLIWDGVWNSSGMKPQVVSTGPTPEWDEGIAWVLDSPPKGMLLFSCWQSGVEEYHAYPTTYTPMVKPILSTSYAWSNWPVIPIVAPTKKPQTTVYVGKIALTVENDFILTLLRLCGPVKSWKHAQDPSNETPRGFGFCEFESTESLCITHAK